MEVSKHVCKFCRKSFSCGRSLGGHMRSHVSGGNYNNSNNNSASAAAEDSVAASATGYGLREKRIKTWRVADTGDGGGSEASPNKLCKQCGKAFHSCKALFGHMKCHSEKGRASVSVEDQDSWTVTDSQSDDNEAPRPRTRTRSKRTRTNCTSSLCFSNPSPSVSEIEQEQQEVALSLIMLSRGSPEMRSEKKSKASELLSPRSGIGKSKTKKLDFKSAMECCEEDDREQGKRNSKFLGSELDSNKSSHRRGKFECTTCNKIFDSYQALGGHRAGHKKITRDCFVPIDETSENSIKPDLSQHEAISGLDLHECSVCLKSFPSEQALDEHKRSHSAEASESRKAERSSRGLIEEPIEKLRELIDLNLPADDAEVAEEVEDSNNNSNSECYRSSSPWWARSIHNKQEVLVAPIL
ncbi:hypothetical protein QN277_014490 [Acacia crassicarpa]|uniref:C2H2-type domain-containing protein n=1 Tax=Acacia crassicarpa TaxID=499986 RepID=A0AAE1IMI5_9FABA|nr:hypothetical protein QN277_014490 [Acacia crassicarpa]